MCRRLPRVPWAPISPSPSHVSSMARHRTSGVPVLLAAACCCLLIAGTLAATAAGAAAATAAATATDAAGLAATSAPVTPRATPTATTVSTATTKNKGTQAPGAAAPAPSADTIPAAPGPIPTQDPVPLPVQDGLPDNPPAPATDPAATIIPTPTTTPTPTPTSTTSNGTGESPKVQAMARPQFTTAYTKSTAAADRSDRVLLRPPAELPPRPTPAPKSEFITIRGTQFLENGRPFYYIGFNAHWLPNVANYEHEWGRKQIVHFMQSAQRLGMRVGRWWAFNKGMPLNKGEYDEDQFLGLDFTLYAASKFGIRVILALTNLWPQYKGPEHYLYMATGSAEGKTVLDYYRDSATRELVKRHFDIVVSRVNAYSGVRYGDDPTIMAWDVMNEPRCPGCTPEEMIVKLNWLKEMASYLRSIDSKHLITQGAEGYFANDPQTNLQLLNPGAGAECEGEDWVTTVSMPEHDFACIHVYERQVEELPFGNVKNPDWVKCDFVCYINWMTRYIEAHEQVATQINKPLVLEEYGLTWWKMWEYDRRVLFQVTFELLIDSRKRGGPFAGALFWNAAANFTGDYDGYNVYTDRWSKPVVQPAPFDYGPTAGSLIPGPSPEGVIATTTKATVAVGARRLQSYIRKDEIPQDELHPALLDLIGNGNLGFGPQAEEGGGAGGGGGSGEGEGLEAGLRKGGGRRLQEQMLELDGFRRAWQRNDCAVRNSRVWRPPAIPSHVNYSAYRQFVEGLDAVDIIAWATKQLETAA